MFVLLFLRQSRAAKVGLKQYMSEDNLDLRPSWPPPPPSAGIVDLQGHSVFAGDGVGDGTWGFVYVQASPQPPKLRPQPLLLPSVNQVCV